MKTMLRMLVLAVGLAFSVLFIAGCGGGGGDNPTTGSMKVTNNASSTVIQLFLSPTSQNTWGPDQLGTSTIPPGGSFILTGIAPGRHDSKVIMSSGNSYTLFDIAINAGETTNVNNPSFNSKLTTNTEPVAIGLKNMNVEMDGTSNYVTSTDVQGDKKE